MALTSTQLTALRADILIDPVLAARPQTPDGAAAIAEAYALTATPPFTVWKRNVSLDEVANNLVGTDLSGLSTLNHTRLQTVVLLSQNGVNAAMPDRRAFFDDIFSGAGGAATRAKLLILWKRLATRAEKLFAVGTGTDAVPATMIFEGMLTYQEVERARELPN